MLELERCADWEARLSQYIADKRDTPFSWGVNDCSQFSSGAVEAVTGVDPIPELRGYGDDEKGALLCLRERGKGTLEKTIDSKFPEVALGKARRGDLAFFDKSVGVVMGRFAWFVSDDGLERVPLSYWDKAWRVG